MTLGEDASTARTGTGPHVMAALRNLVISILRMAGHVSVAVAVRKPLATLCARSGCSQAGSNGQQWDKAKNLAG